MIIQIGNTYEVCAYHKKSMYEIEQFSHDDGRQLNVETCWRNAVFYVKIDNELEQSTLQACIYTDSNTPDIWDDECYTNIEMHDSIDSNSQDFVHYSNHFTVEQQDDLNNAYDSNQDSDDAAWDKSEWLQDTHDFVSYASTWQVHGGVMVEETDYVLDDMSVCTL